MGAIQLFHATLDGARELEETPFRNEKELQRLFDRHLHDLTGIAFVDSEHYTGSRHKRRADTLGLDDKQRPVVIEYKLGPGGAAISQGLDYLDWLKDHKGDFRELVREELGTERTRGIDFKNAWLLCVAGEFRREDILSAQTNTHRIELLSVRRQGESTILLKWAHREEGVSKSSTPAPVPVPVSSPDEPEFYIYPNWDKASAELRQLFMELHDFIFAQGEDVQIIPYKFYISFYRNKHYLIAVKLQTWYEKLLVYSWLDPGVVELDEGFTRDISENRSHPGKMEITIRDRGDLERAKPLLKRSYEEAGHA